MAEQYAPHQIRNTGLARWLCIAVWTLLVAPTVSLLVAFVGGFVFGLVSLVAVSVIVIPMALTLPWVLMLVTMLLGIWHKLPGT